MNGSGQDNSFALYSNKAALWLFSLVTEVWGASVPKLVCEWFKSFLSQRRQWVRIPGFPCSQWLLLNGGVPQGSLFGPISVIIHIDDLSLLCNVLKYVDDTALSEIIASSSSVSNMQSLLNQFLISADENSMHINCKNTKEMILGSTSKRDWPILCAVNSWHTPGKSFHLQTLGAFHFCRLSLGNTHWVFE